MPAPPCSPHLGGRSLDLCELPGPQVATRDHKGRRGRCRIPRTGCHNPPGPGERGVEDRGDPPGDLSPFLRLAVSAHATTEADRAATDTGGRFAVVMRVGDAMRCEWRWRRHRDGSPNTRADG